MMDAATKLEKIPPRAIILARWDEMGERAADLPAILSGGDVATVIFVMPETPAHRQIDALKSAVEAVQRANVAALVFAQSQLVGRTGADGLLVDGTAQTPEEVAAICGKLRPEKIVGVLAPFSRHQSMLLAESGCDFILFGRPGSDTHAPCHPKIIDLAGWWSELFEIPVVALAGNSLGSVAQLTAAGADFIMVDSLVWLEGAPAANVGGINAAIKEAFAAR